MHPIKKKDFETVFIEKLEDLTLDKDLLKAQKVIIIDLWKDRYQDTRKDRKASKEALRRENEFETPQVSLLLAENQGFPASDSLVVNPQHGFPNLYHRGNTSKQASKVLK